MNLNLPKIRVHREGNNYIVIRPADGENEEDELANFDRSVYGDEVALKMAQTYAQAWKDGYSQSIVDCAYTDED